MKEKNQKNINELKLEGELIVQRAGELKEALIEAINNSNIVHINHEQVEDFDLTYMQLLIASQKYSNEKNHSLNINEGNEKFLELARMSGLNGHFFNTSGRK